MGIKTKREKIGEIEIPTDYFNMTAEEKHSVCLGLFEVMIDTLNRTTKPEFDRFMILDKLLDSSIQTNVEEENYEVAAVLRDIQTLINA
jgi:hypothetical protein